MDIELIKEISKRIIFLILFEEFIYLKLDSNGVLQQRINNEYPLKALRQWLEADQVTG